MMDSIDKQEIKNIYFRLQYLIVNLAPSNASVKFYIRS